ncbi:MAG: hypothetical protein ABSE73_24095 [Planctomycetota bacterium]
MAPNSKVMFAAAVLVIAGMAGMTAPFAAEEEGFEDPGAAGAGPFITGEIKGAPKVMGHRGFLIVRSPQRWEQIREALAGLGWKDPANNPLAQPDFSRDLVVGAFACGDGTPFHCHWVASNVKESEVRFLLTCPQVTTDEEAPEWPFASWIFAFATVPKAERVKASLAHFSPAGTIADSWNMWTETFDGPWSDVVDGLSAVITPKERRIKAGADIPMDFKLVFQVVKSFSWEHPGNWRVSTFVWDGKYSKGYRNSAYLVVTPDGNSRLLRKPEQRQWDKNAPQLIEITPERSYVLPKWFEGQTTQSLKELGLDTSKPGVYRITGVYMETGGPGQTSDGKKVEIWGGNIASATVEVEATE